MSAHKKLLFLLQPIQEWRQQTVFARLLLKGQPARSGKIGHAKKVGVIRVRLGWYEMAGVASRSETTFYFIGY